jgi:hypothetical protein
MPTERTVAANCAGGYVGSGVYLGTRLKVGRSPIRSLIKAKGLATHSAQVISLIPDGFGDAAPVAEYVPIIISTF